MATKAGVTATITGSVHIVDSQAATSQESSTLDIANKSCHLTTLQPLLHDHDEIAVAEWAMACTTELQMPLSKYSQSYLYSS